MTIHSIPVWTYWQGPKSPLIDLCIQSIERWNPSTVCLDEDKVRDLGGGHILDQTDGVMIPYRSDLLRAWLLHEFGGVWVDADCICTAPIDFLDEVPDHDLIGVFNKHQKKGWGRRTGVLATPIAGCKASPIWAEALESVGRSLESLKAGRRVMYGQTSVGIASQLYKAHKESPRVKRFAHWKYNPVPWYKARDIYFQAGVPWQHETRGSWNPNAVLYHLTNVVTKTWEDRTRQELFNGPSFISFLLQKAFTRRPAIFGRTVEILKRLPSGPCNAVEVGVLKGVNARHLLQQNRNLELTLVDRWGVHPMGGSFRASGDYMSRWSQATWDKIYREVIPRHLNFAPERWKTLRADSIEAATKVPDASQDLVFIDGDHSYPGVKGDLTAWFPKVKDGGWIGGHDYGNRKNKKGLWGVNQAVDELAKQLGQEVQRGLDNTWFLKKGTF